MEAPLCEMCLKNEDLLCSGCQKNLDEGKISHTEVELSRTLYDLRDRFKSIDAGGFRRAEDLGDMILVIVPTGGAGKIIGKGGAITKRLQREMGKRVKIIEDGSLEEVTKELIGKSDLIGINEVFSRDGEYYRIRVREGRMRRPPLKKEKMEEIIETVTGDEVEIVSE